MWRLVFHHTVACGADVPSQYAAKPTEMTAVTGDGGLEQNLNTKHDESDWPAQNDQELCQLINVVNGQV